MRSRTPFSGFDPMKTLCLFFLCTAQISTAEATSPPVSIGEWRTLDSKVLEEERELLVYLPNSYRIDSQRSQSYPVLYLLDGRSNFKHTAGIIHSLSESGAIPRMLIVGIANTNRWRDLTPTASVEHPESGGGDRFLEFLRDELIPYIDHTYRTRDYRLFAGHSLGGLMVLHALMTVPDTFDAYLAQSPSLEWDPSFLPRLESYLKESTTLPKQVHLSLGDERATREPFRRLVGVFDFKAPEDLDWDWFLDDRENHMTVRVTATLRGIQSIYSDWNLNSAEIVETPLARIEDHYRQASEKYRTPRFLSEGRLIEAGYFAIYHKRSIPRALELFELAVERFPGSPYAHDSLGEGFEHAGRFEEALAKYKRAFTMAKSLRIPDLGYYQGHLNRIREKLTRQDDNRN